MCSVELALQAHLRVEWGNVGEEVLYLNKLMS